MMEVLECKLAALHENAVVSWDWEGFEGGLLLPEATDGAAVERNLRMTPTVTQKIKKMKTKCKHGFRKRKTN